MINWPVTTISLAVSLLSVPIYIENRSLSHLYAWIFVQITVSAGLGWLTPPEITWQAAGILLSSHATYIISWSIGTTADLFQKANALKKLGMKRKEQKHG
jgi:hypothetical protein